MLELLFEGLHMECPNVAILKAPHCPKHRPLTLNPNRKTLMDVLAVSVVLASGETILTPIEVFLLRPLADRFMLFRRYEIFKHEVLMVQPFRG